MAASAKCKILKGTSKTEDYEMLSKKFETKIIKDITIIVTYKSEIEDAVINLLNKHFGDTLYNCPNIEKLPNGFIQYEDGFQVDNISDFDNEVYNDFKAELKKL